MSERDTHETSNDPNGPAPPDPRADAADDLTSEDSTVDAAILERRVEQLISADALPEAYVPVVEEQEGPDAADTLERLEDDESREVLRRMDNEKSAEALANMPPELAATMLLDSIELGDGLAAEYVSLMDPDDAADIIQVLETPIRERLLAELHPRRAAQIGKLVLYDPETAGGLMTTNILVVRDALTIGQAIDAIKKKKINENQADVYVVNDKRELVGEISLRDLIIEDDDDLVRDHLDDDVISVTPAEDQEEVARLFERYDLLTLPVVDERRRIMGMVTIDDVVDIIRDEHTEDALKQVGAGAGEAVYSTVGKKVRGRMPWLVVNLVTASLAASVLLLFADMIELIPVAAILFPIIANQSGNTGFQSLAVTLRGITLKEIHKERVGPLVVREALSGGAMGLGVGVLLCLGVIALGALGQGAGSEAAAEVFAGFTWRIGVIAGAAMTFAMFASALIGTLIPILMEKIGADPATASSIFLVTFTDSLSFGAFLGLIFLLQAWIREGPPIEDVLSIIPM